MSKECRLFTPMTPFPAPNRLHVWWARRPLVASRAVVLAALLPEDADHDRFQHMLGIQGMPRRVADYAADAGWTEMNLISTVGAFLIAASMTLWNR